ncbi:MAG: MBOAT family protein [Paludibacteraceae bacterium]|nr:MBOAT family protein [Paludibacteraceae bacterium]
MVFADLFFLFGFLPAFAICYLLARLLDQGFESLSCRNWVLVFFSLVFYAWGEPVYVLLMIGCVLMNYLAGLVIDRANDTWRTVALVVGLVCNIGILGTFKYANMIAETLSSFGLPVANPHIALPIGISFYTFQSISYLIDVYRYDSPAQRRFSNLLLYISMFPQLIAGPIVRYDTVASEIEDREVTADDVAEGLYRFMLGLGKKVIIANQISAVADQLLGQLSEQTTSIGAATGLIAFALQIYFDFSGYSDMAIGIGRCLGFHFKENFDHPYCCTSITDFWRRWHMSLGSFFRDYVYIPMGGNRRHQSLNILVVWFLTGLWHGASWNFVIWGMYFGLIVALEKFTIVKLEKNLWLRPLLHVYSLVIVLIGWGVFYFDDFGQMLLFFRQLFTAGGGLDFLTRSLVMNKLWLWVLAIVCCLPLRDWLKRGVENETARMVCHILVSIVILGVSIALLVGATNNPFLYTRF